MSDNSYGTTFGPSAPGAINLVSGDTGNVDTAHTANAPSVATSTAPERRPHRGRQRRLLADERRPALLGRLLDPRRGRDDGHEHRRRAQRRRALAGAGSRAASVPATSYPAALAATGDAGQPTSTFIPDEFSRLLDRRDTVRRTRATRGSATPSTRSASPSAAPASGGTRTTTSRTTSRSSTTPRRPTRTT